MDGFGCPTRESTDHFIDGHIETEKRNQPIAATFVGKFFSHEAIILVDLRVRLQQ